MSASRSPAVPAPTPRSPGRGAWRRRAVLGIWRLPGGVAVVHGRGQPPRALGVAPQPYGDAGLAAESVGCRVGGQFRQAGQRRVSVAGQVSGAQDGARPPRWPGSGLAVTAAGGRRGALALPSRARRAGGGASAAAVPAAARRPGRPGRRARPRIPPARPAAARCAAGGRPWRSVPSARRGRPGTRRRRPAALPAVVSAAQPADVGDQQVRVGGEGAPQ